MDPVIVAAIVAGAVAVFVPLVQGVGVFVRDSVQSGIKRRARRERSITSFLYPLRNRCQAVVNIAALQDCTVGELISSVLVSPNAQAIDPESRQYVERQYHELEGLLSSATLPSHNKELDWLLKEVRHHVLCVAPAFTDGLLLGQARAFVEAHGAPPFTSLVQAVDLITDTKPGKNTLSLPKAGADAVVARPQIMPPAK